MYKKKIFPCELGLILAIIINSFSVSLISKSNFGITTLSSVPLVLSHIFTSISFGAWNFIVQSATILVLISITRQFKIGYLLSFIIAIVFSVMLDISKFMMLSWPVSFSFRVIYFVLGLLLLTIGASLFIKCKLPALPFDTFVRDMTEYLNVPIKRVKTTFDLICVAITLILSFSMLGYMDSVGIGTIIGAIVTGSITNSICNYLDKRYVFNLKFSFLKKLL